MKLVLNIQDISLGYLIEENNKYKFFANSKNFDKALKLYPIIKNLDLNSSGIGIYDKIPYPVSNYLSGTSREDIVALAKIKKSDSTFEKLYKLAGLDYMHELFWISQD